MKVMMIYFVHMKLVTLCVGEDFCEKYSQKVKKYAPKNITAMQF